VVRETKEHGKVKTTVRLTVNGTRHEAEIDTRMLLVDLLRDRFNLTGTHVGCLTGNCGACTVIMDGLTVKSCTILAADTEGSEVLTVEGFTPQTGGLHPLQQAFVEFHALQCGYCTPGMVLSAHHLLQEHPDPDESTIRHAIAGNLCRCTGYQNIVRAIQAVAARRNEKPKV
jgi:aerobic carbon-monoxide dehydrogenase small subunit